MAGVVMNADASIGEGCIINTSSSVDHDNVLADFVHVSVGAHLAGTVKVGKGAWIGAGAVVSNNISICREALVGAGAVVVCDITEPGTYIGVPAKRKEE
jgi:acetyltransferase-like isoleucine patch superfamily enzyme